MTANRIWKIVGSVVAAGMLVGGTAQVASALAHEEHTETERVDAAGVATLDVHNTAGSIRVVGVAGADSITVRAHISDGLRATGHHIEQDGDRLLVEGSCPNFLGNWCSTSYTIEVPTDIAVVARSDDHIEVSDIEGDVDASADQSSIELARIGGAVVANSDQGRITGTDLRAGSVQAGADQGRIRLEFAEPPRAVAASADQGDVDIVLPDTGESYAVAVSTDQGNASYPIRTDPDSDRAITAESDQGDVTISYATR
jgi:hypothetical protein